MQSGAGVAGAVVWPGGQPGILYVPEFAPLDPQLGALAGIEPEPTFRSEQVPSFAVYPLAAPPAGRQDMGLAFAAAGCAPSLALQGLTAPVSTSDRLDFAGWWRVVDWLPGDLAIFAHLTDVSGKIVAQHDGLDAAATTLWPGDVILQRHSLTMPPDLPPGRYLLQLGLYQRDNGRRLTVPDGRDVLEVARCEAWPSVGVALLCRLTDSH